MNKSRKADRWLKSPRSPEALARDHARELNAARFKASFLGKNDGPADKIGEESERRFEEMVGLLSRWNHLEWMRGFRRATAEEDWLRGTDFVARALGQNGDGSSEFFIDYQIKSSVAGAKEFLEERPDSGVHVIVMRLSFGVASLRRVLDAIYYKELRDRGIRPWHHRRSDRPAP